MEALCHDTGATTSVLQRCGFPMARLAKRQGCRPLSVSQLLGARCLQASCLQARCLVARCFVARCLVARCLVARCLVGRCLRLQTSLEAELYLRAVNSGGRYINKYR